MPLSIPKFCRTAALLIVLGASVAWADEPAPETVATDDAVSEDAVSEDTAPEDAAAEDTASERVPWTWSLDAQVLGGLDMQQVRTDSVFNPQNRIARIPDGQTLLELRPDFRVAHGRFSLDVGPRVIAAAVKSGLGPAQDGSIRGSYDFFVNRWRVKAQLTPALSASFGREVLQWGNGVFRSPSNPFLVDNGRLNPIRELPGRDFAVVTYLPSQSLAVSLISNTGPGHESSSGAPFDATHAVKVDYVGKSFNTTIIGSHQEGAGLRLGGSYTYTASDAVLVYGEMTAAQGTLAYYPELAADEAGWRLVPRKESSGQVFFTNLIGVSYTFPSGLLTTVEYLHNNEGYRGEEARAFSSLGRSASELLHQGGPAAPLGAQLLGQALNTGLRVERRNYLFVQALLPEYRNRADLAVSYARNLDTGGGGTFSGYAAVSIKGRTQLYGVASYNHGPAGSEFVRLQRFTLSGGARLFFDWGRQ